MARSPNRRRPRKRTLFNQQSAFSNQQSGTIPRWCFNTILGFFLMPVAVVWSQTFFTCFSGTLHQGFWRSEEFWFFALGALLWTIAFFGLPRPLIVYVFG